MSPPALAAAVFGASCLFSGAAAAEERDPWFGEDKLLHFSISAALAGGGYAGASLFVDPAWQRASVGAGFALSLGAAKELYDLTGRGDPSWRDFAWDALGTTVGVAVALAVDAALSSGDSAEQQTSKRGMAIRF